MKPTTQEDLCPTKRHPDQATPMQHHGAFGAGLFLCLAATEYPVETRRDQHRHDPTATLPETGIATHSGRHHRRTRQLRSTRTTSSRSTKTESPSTSITRINYSRRAGFERSSHRGHIREPRRRARHLRPTSRRPSRSVGERSPLTRALPPSWISFRLSSTRKPPSCTKP
jgi:hypothetical protein